VKVLAEIKRETYGHNDRAINKHSDRTYKDAKGNLYVLSRTLDGCPPFFEAYGPYRASHEGALPRLRVMDKDYWGDGWTWPAAVMAFCRELCATIRKE